MPKGVITAPGYNATNLPPGSTGTNTATPTQNGNPTYENMSQDTGPNAILTATFPQPISTTKPPPIVMSSQDAKDHVATMQNSVDTANNDVANANASKNQPTQTGSKTDSNTKTDTSTTPTTNDYESAINSILGNLGDGSDTAQASPIQQEQENGINADLDPNNLGSSAYVQEQTANTINSINNGSYPLSANEQAQVSAIRGSYADALKQQQQQAAIFGSVANLPGAFAEGLSVSQATIENAINSAGTNIAKINTDILDAQSKLTTALLNGDYKSATALYTQASNKITQRNTELAAVQKTIDDQTTQMRDNAKTALTTLVDEQKMDATDAQNTINNAYKSGMLDVAQQKLLLAKNTANQVSTAINAPPVQMLATNKPDVAGQKTFLNSLPGGANGKAAALVQGIANYTINPASLSTSAKQALGGLTRGDAVALASQYDPTYSESNFANRQALVKNFTSGAYSQNINALNTAVGHIADLTGNFSGLGNIGFTPYNWAKNNVESVFGSGQPGKAGLNISAATGELASVFKKSGATDSEIKNLGTLDANSSPEQVKAYQEAATQLLASRLSALEDTYTQGMGKAPSTSFLSSASSAALLKLQQSGLDIKVPQLAEVPTVKLQTFHDADPNNAALIDSIMQANPTYKPEDVVNVLESEGLLQ